MALHPTLNDFLKLIQQVFSLYFHQVLMKEVCHSIKAHDHWVCTMVRLLPILHPLQSLW